MRKFILRLPVPKEIQDMLMKIVIEEGLDPYITSEGLNIITDSTAEEKVSEYIKTIDGSVVIDSAVDEITFVDFV